ncbi:MAG TPA: GNAT family N-acetyltransferase [Acidimicrobiales bacterium]|nr:GNAT family N-acetyltransferase [Acidimicrobiales bacterium]
MAFSCENHGIIRLATPSDALDALALRGEATGLSADRAREILEGAIAASECLVDVDASNKLTGFVITNTRAFFGRDFIKLLLVAPTHRRTGIGRALLEAAVSGASTATIFSSTNESNAAMRALFEHDGWTLSGVLSGIDEGDPEMVFWRAR